MNYILGLDAHDVKGQFAARKWLCDSEILLKEKFANWIFEMADSKGG